MLEIGQLYSLIILKSSLVPFLTFKCDKNRARSLKLVQQLLPFDSLANLFVNLVEAVPVFVLDVSTSSS